MASNAKRVFSEKFEAGQIYTEYARHIELIGQDERYSGSARQNQAAEREY
jgi:hypothetical protein